jgi:tRNA pseudouridine55 synthase
MTTADALSYDGVLPVDKPVGPTSHDAVARARRALRTRRIGHTGTLDPFASGLLLLCVGPATRAAEYLTGLDKGYHATVRLGATTDTDDLTGVIVAEADPSAVTREAVEAILATMVGTIMQRPPAYSAKKREGERAYTAARAGRPLELDPVAVRIDALRVTAFQLPDVALEVRCGSGTYIRAIARDLGAALGVGAHLTALRRTTVGSHHVDAAVPLDELDDVDRVAAAFIPALDALRHLPRVELDAGQVAEIRHGRAIRTDDGGVTAGSAEAGTPQTVVLGRAGALIAIGERRGTDIRPRKVFA